MNVGDLVAEGWVVYAVPASLYGDPTAESLIQGNASEGLINLSCCIDQPGYTVWYYMAVSPTAKPAWDTAMPNAYQVDLGEDALTSEIPGTGMEPETGGVNPLGFLEMKVPFPGIKAIPMWLLALVLIIFLRKRGK